MNVDVITLKHKETDVRLKNPKTNLAVLGYGALFALSFTRGAFVQGWQTGLLSGLALTLAAFFAMESFASTGRFSKGLLPTVWRVVAVCFFLILTYAIFTSGVETYR